MKFCSNCGKEVQEGIKFCPECGVALITEQQPVSDASSELEFNKFNKQLQIREQKRSKKAIGCLIVAILFIGSIGFGISQIVRNPERYQKQTEEIDIIFDATRFYVSETQTVSESKLIEMLGEPNSIEEWNFKTSSESYPIRTLHYGNYSYSFNLGMLQRISIDEEIAYENKDDILKQFGLKKYNNSIVKDTNTSIRITNCGVHDFWIQYDDSKKTMNSIKISYGSLFSK